MITNFVEDEERKRHWLVGVGIGFGALITPGVLVF